MAAREAGVERVGTTQEFVDPLYTLCRRTPVTGSSLGIITVSGGAGVLMADAAAECGFDVPPLPQAALGQRLASGSAVNPVDTTAQAMNDMTLVRDAMRVMMAHDGFDAIIGFFMNWPDSPALGAPLRTAIAEGMANGTDRTVAICMNSGPATVADFERAGMLVFDDPSYAIRALAGSRRLAVALARDRDAVIEIKAAAPLPGEALDEAGAGALLVRAGIPMAPVSVAKGASAAEDAARIAKAFNSPVALKILSPRYRAQIRYRRRSAQSLRR